MKLATPNTKPKYSHVICLTERIYQDLRIQQDAVLWVAPPAFLGTIFRREGKFLLIVGKVLGRLGYQILDDSRVYFRNVIAPRAVRTLLKLSNKVSNNTI